MRTLSDTDITKTGAVQSSALTLRGIDPALRAALEAEAARLGLSLNAVTLKVLRDALGLAESAELFHDLDALAGTWTPVEAEGFTTAIRAFEEIDPAMWQPDAEPS